ncbi:regulatory protein RecX [Paenibacillus lemnae]|uniref:Regulatory protein RecX n=2 Tax=Paenibacillus lemnae TaxID=1330551 RepID=A0A848M555_PAELE|nr:RecX family transcriptional regulator [Paenibacillus lemnae]NMO96238.1 regulatory protein RecX [Paenibacillus lemnae]
MDYSKESHESGGDYDISHFPEGEDLVVTAVEALRKPKYRYSISFGPYNMTVHEDVMIKFRMTKGSVFRKEELQEIITADEQQRAYVEALRYLERKPRTAKEIQTRLHQKGMMGEAVNKALHRLSEEGLVNDDWYARQWAQQRITGQKKGKMWIRQELRQKGIDSEIIAEALQEVDEEDELASCYSIGRKKWLQGKGDAAERKRKTGAFLMRRGFRGEQVRKVINRLIQETEQDESFQEDEPFM